MSHLSDAGFIGHFFALQALPQGHIRSDDLFPSEFSKHLAPCARSHTLPQAGIPDATGQSVSQTGHIHHRLLSQQQVGLVVEQHMGEMVHFLRRRRPHTRDKQAGALMLHKIPVSVKIRHDAGKPHGSGLQHRQSKGFLQIVPQGKRNTSATLKRLRLSASSGGKISGNASPMFRARAPSVWG